MEEESHLNPNHQKSETYATNIKPFNFESPKPESKIVVYLLLALVLSSIAFLIFGLVVLRFRTPTLRLSNVAVNDLSYSSNTTSLNVTVTATLRLRNTNFGSFEFHAGSATVLHGNATIGTTTIDGGEVGSRERREMKATVEVRSGSENYVNMSESDLVELRSYAELRGEIRVMKIVNRHRTAFMNCSMDLNLTSQAIQSFLCR